MEDTQDQIHVFLSFFDGFELLDLFGPLEMMTISNRMKQRSGESDMFVFHYFSAQKGSIFSGNGDVSIGGVPIVVDESFDSVLQFLHTTKNRTALIIPGGMGTRQLVEQQEWISFLQQANEKVSYILSVCTGAALLNKAGILANKRATTNKRAWEWVIAQKQGELSPPLWIRKARWVVDGKIWTSSGVSAGMDMLLSWITSIKSRPFARLVASQAEYVWNEDSMNDPFS